MLKMVNLTMDAILLSAEKAGVFQVNELSGCNEEEITEILKDQNILNIPEQLDLFYRTMGRQAGDLFAGEFILFPGILGKKSGYLKCLQEANADKGKFENAFVFLNHHDYQFFLCFVEEGDSVYFFDEEMEIPRLAFNSFFEYLEYEIKRFCDLRAQRYSE
jgi:hypothetical protein